MFGQIEHIFFDLDNTLWDFEYNSRNVIRDLFNEYNLSQRCRTDFVEFLRQYEQVNLLLWDKLKKSEISKEQLRSSRFYNSMQMFGYDDFDLGLRLEQEYVKRSPYQKKLIDGATGLLQKLQSNYQLHIITNGFKEVQYTKLENCMIREFFSDIIISEEVGFSKPDRRIFEQAMRITGARPHASLMVGDDMDNDFHGAIAAGMHAVHFDRNNSDSHVGSLRINALPQLIELLGLGTGAK